MFVNWFLHAGTTTLATIFIVCPFPKIDFYCFKESSYVTRAPSWMGPYENRQQITASTVQLYLPFVLQSKQRIHKL